MRYRLITIMLKLFCFHVLDGKPQLPGYIDAKGQFHKVPEMVPEFVVPDLDGFEVRVRWSACQ